MTRVLSHTCKSINKIIYYSFARKQYVNVTPRCLLFIYLYLQITLLVRAVKETDVIFYNFFCKRNKCLTERGNTAIARRRLLRVLAQFEKSVVNNRTSNELDSILDRAKVNVIFLQFNCPYPIILLLKFSK